MLKQRLTWDCTYKKAYDDFIKCVEENRDGCDEVWFFMNPQFSTIENLKKRIDEYKPYFERLRSLGVRVCVQDKTFGDQTLRTPHYDFGGIENMRDELFSVDQKGNVNFGQFCWRKREYRDYKSKVLTLFCKELSPYAIYFDDDMRVFNYKSPLRCFCDDCIAEFNRRNGTSYTREELDCLIRTDMTMREKYLNFSYDGIADFCREMGKVIKNCSPDVHVGVQHGSYSGKAFAHSLKAFYESTGRTVMSRCGGGAYNDDDPNALVEKTFDTQWQLVNLPEGVEEKCNEIENYPNLYYCKTINGTMLEATMHLASGFNSVSLVLAQRYDKFMVLDGIKECAVRRKYWDMLVKANEGCVKGGLSVYVPEKYWALDREEWMTEPWKHGHKFNYLGIPVTYAKPASPVYYLPSEYAETLTDGEVKMLLKSPVVTTGKVLEILQKKGYGKLLNVEAHAIDNAFPYYEKFTDHSANAATEDEGWGQSLFVADNHYFTGDADVLSVYGAAGDAAYGTDLCGKAAAVIFTTAENGKWFVQGYREEDVITSFGKKKQIDYAIEKIGGVSCGIASRNRLMLIPSEDADGKTHSVTFVNTTIQIQKNAVITVRNPLTEKAVYSDEYGDTRALKTEKTAGGVKFVLPDVSPWTACTVFFK